jgi:predicted ATPase
MRFVRLSLGNWKNFTKVEKVELAEQVYLIGPNASGKSNLLDALKFLHDLAAESGGLQRAINEMRDGVVGVRSLHAGRVTDVKVSVEVEIVGTRWSYEIIFNRVKGRVQVVREVVRKGEALVLQRPDGEDKGDADRMLQTALEQTSANKAFRELVQAFRSIEYVSLVPQLIREGQRSPGVSPGRDPLGRDFLDTLAGTNERQRTKRLNLIGSALRKIVPQFEALSLIRDERGRPHLEARFRHWRRSDAKQRESQLSDGTLRLIAMLWQMQDSGGPLLLDEPEWSLHDAVLRKLARVFAKVQERQGGRQVIVATHSQSLLSDPSIGYRSILLVNPTGNGSTVEEAKNNRRIVKLMEAGLPPSEAALPETGPQLALNFAVNAS